MKFCENGKGKFFYIGQPANIAFFCLIIMGEKRDTIPFAIISTRLERKETVLRLMTAAINMKETYPKEWRDDKWIAK